MKKIPMRQCVGCREMKPKNEMLRVVRTPDGTIAIDGRGKMSGRGAYVCSRDCLRKAVKSNALSRNLDTPVPEEILAQLEKQMEEETDGR